MMDPRNISAVFITKDATYPREILNHALAFPFGEILILTNCDSPHRKQELFAKAKYDTLYYQDDDCIAPIGELLEAAKPNIINCAMKPHHLQVYARSRIALLGWGSIFPKSAIRVLDLYRVEFGEDFIYKRETERIMTYLCYPQNRFDLPIQDLPSAFAPDRLSNQPGHYSYIQTVENRCAFLETQLMMTTA
jgi:hypothetical protein